MKKIFTLPLLLIVFHMSLRAQSWQDVGADSVALGNLFFFNNQAGLTMALDTLGHPYIFYIEGAPSIVGGQVLASYFDGTNWNTINPSLSSVPDRIAGVVDRSGNAYLGYNDLNQLPEVEKFAANTWSPVGTGVSNTGYTALSMSVSSTGTLYYAFYGSNPEVFRFDGSSWTEFGSAALGNGSGGKVVQVTVDRHDTLYAAYDEVNPTAGQAPLLIVEKYNGTNWVRVGASTLYATEAQNILAFDANNIPYVVSATGNDATGYNFQLEKLSGGDWTPVGPTVSSVPGSPGRGGSPAASNSQGVAQIYLAFGAGNVPCIGWYQNSADTNLKTAPQILVEKYNGTVWVPVATNGINQHAAIDNDMWFSTDAHGKLYVSYIDIDNIIYVKTVESVNVATITFSNIVLTYGDPDFVPNATSTNTDSNDPIQYSIADTTVATFVNGRIHILKVGYTTITASQPADANYSTASLVTVGLWVNSGVQTISFPGWPQKKVGDPDFAAGGFASSGLPVTYKGSDPTIATVNPDGTIHIIEQGAIIVTAHQAGDSNYGPAPDVAQVLIINGADSTDSTSSGSPGRGKGKIIAYCNSRSSLLVQVTPPVDGPALLEVYNSFGWRIYSKEINLSVKGSDTFLVPVGELPGGIYYVRVKGNGYNLIQSIWIK